MERNCLKYRYILLTVIVIINILLFIYFFTITSLKRLQVELTVHYKILNYPIKREDIGIKILRKLVQEIDSFRDAIELSESSLDVNLTANYLRCKVAAGTPPLNNITFYERSPKVVILAATVSSVHRLIFPHPEILDRKATFGSLSNTATSIFHDTIAIQVLLTPVHHY
ncbi:unnamed protein product [Leptidea sinapis]|uniref:Nucleoporin Nup120/160 beta-propeller domain-containing protein n=1 Tax=Leptidea sinapis TaxID=189913 RepID=A0A5E4QZQ7_9NEOP|nr:unnamed protein product [Leptidea sinapis]